MLLYCLEVPGWQAPNFASVGEVFNERFFFLHGCILGFQLNVIVIFYFYFYLLNLGCVHVFCYDNSVWSLFGAACLFLSVDLLKLESNCSHVRKSLHIVFHKFSICHVSVNLL